MREDGILDLADQCPNEAEDMDGIQDEDGCPETDVDGDGIDDPQDRCPLEAEDMDGLADEDGCPESDVDGDGILDPLDECPLEPEDKDGVEDKDGCPDVDVTTLTRTEIFTRENIKFRTERARIDRKFYRTMEEVLFLMEKNKELKFLIEGHTDDRGPTEYNQKLSERRAASVRRWFLLRAKDRDSLEKRLLVRGKGEGTPEGSNSSRRGRRSNRRVMFLVIREEKISR